MNTRIWRLAGVSLLALSISAQVLADDNNQQQQQQRNEQQQRQQQQRGFEMQRQQQENQRGFNDNQQREQQQQRQQQQNQQQQQRQQEQVQQQRQIQQNQQERANQQRQQQDRERNQQRDDQRQQQRQQQQDQQRRQQEQQQQQRQLQDRQGGLPIQGRPDTVVQTQEPRQGFYRDQPRDNRWRDGDRRPDNGNWQAGRPGGHGDGWGSGPRYRPGYEIDRMPGGYSRVPYRGGDYFYSGGYWYRPQGPRYVVVQPPRGVRVRYLPDYAQQVWLGSALFFVAAGTYYTYEQNTQEYVVAEPPQNVEPVYSPQQPQPVQQAANPYDVVAYPPEGKPQQEIEQDRYDCYRYAVQQSNFDPAGAAYQPAPEVLGVYRQAMASCYAGRGYSIQQ
ncbi:hypothetical protein QWI20_15280 [Pseudomonas sp. W2-17]